MEIHWIEGRGREKEGILGFWFVKWNGWIIMQFFELGNTGKEPDDF